ncbi:MAG: hypothetical protein GY929_04115 [Actinomycetia bacterium]|nr:hypothetical protein [Actinomycetes bacterium]
MKIHKLESSDAFVAFDLADTVQSVGIVRCARKILQGGAGDLARSTTYAAAAFGRRLGGASAGINAMGDAREGAISAFVEELTPMVAEGRFLVDAGKGVAPAELAGLAAADPRDARRHDPAVLGAGVVAAAAAVLGGELSGRTAAVEGLDATSLGVVSALEAAGVGVVAVSTAKGTAVVPDGVSAADLAAALAAHGPDLVSELGVESSPAWKVFGAPADLLLPGSKMGALTHQGAELFGGAAVVPWSPIPVTAKALAVLRKADVAVLPDFVTTGAPLLASWPQGSPSDDELIASVSGSIADVIDSVRGHADGPLLGACYRAEEFLGSWQDSLPFGRPLAA